MPYVLKYKLKGLVNDPEYVHCVTEDDFIRNICKFPKGDPDAVNEWIDTIQRYVEDNLIPIGALPEDYDHRRDQYNAVFIAGEWNEDEQSLYRERVYITQDEYIGEILTHEMYETMFGRLLYTREHISFEEMVF